jgi:hypothetical protein
MLERLGRIIDEAEVGESYGSFGMVASMEAGRITHLKEHVEKVHK